MKRAFLTKWDWESWNTKPPSPMDQYTRCQQIIQVTHSEVSRRLHGRLDNRVTRMVKCLLYAPSEKDGSGSDDDDQKDLDFDGS